MITTTMTTTQNAVASYVLAPHASADQTWSHTGVDEVVNFSPVRLRLALGFTR